MQKHKLNKTTVFRFRRFCRAAYAAFNSLHRVVNIGRLASYIADRQLHKSAVATAFCLALLPVQSWAQADDTLDEHTLPVVDIIVQADTLFGSPEPAAVLTAEHFSNSSVRTLGDLIAMLPGVDLRSRGGNDVQGDLAMRGGSFDQTVLLLNGINLTDAQTGHHILDLPVDISMVQRVELLSPAQLMARGIASFCGAVNIVVCEEYRDHLLAHLSAGSYGTAKASLLATKTAGPWAVTVAGAYNRSDGYMPNTDYHHGSLFLQAARHSSRHDWHLQLGGQTKDFGSQAFYSIAYPDQFEATRTLTGSLLHIRRWQDTRMETALYGRLHSDRFELFRDGYAVAPAWYSGHNRHLSSISGLRSRLSRKLGIGQALAGVELRREGIWSNVLGEPDSTLHAPYTHAVSRLNATLFTGYAVTLGPLQAEATALGLYNTAMGFDYGLSLSARYRIARNAHLAASVSRAHRKPTFTDLYYQSVNHVANPALNGEHSLTAELSAHYTPRHFALQATLYHRAGRDIIDWVRSPDEEIWYAMNHTAVNATGVDLSFTYRPQHALQPSVGGCYSYCHINRLEGEQISAYALEHLRHKALFYAALSPLPRLRLKADAEYRLREGVFTDGEGNLCNYGAAWLLNAVVEYTLTPLRGTALTLYAEGRNLLDTQYRDHGGVPQPGRTIMAGLKLNMDKQ